MSIYCRRSVFFGHHPLPGQRDVCHSVRANRFRVTSDTNSLQTSFPCPENSNYQVCGPNITTLPIRYTRYILLQHFLATYMAIII